MKRILVILFSCILIYGCEKGQSRSCSFSGAIEYTNSTETVRNTQIIINTLSDAGSLELPYTRSTMAGTYSGIAKWEDKEKTSFLIKKVKKYEKIDVSLTASSNGVNTVYATLHDGQNVVIPTLAVKKP